MGTHIEIICQKCEHRVRFHEKASGSCIVENCNCKKFEPKEIERDDKEQHDIITVVKDKKGKIIEVESKLDDKGNRIAN